MKHSLKITLILLALFFSAQIIGLLINYQYLDKDLPLNIEKPQVEQPSTSYIQISFIIILATIIAFILTRLKAIKVWKVWFFISVAFCLLVAFAIIFNDTIALLLALTLAFFKVFKQNTILHNLTELFIYAGLTAIFLPILNIMSITVLLILISGYDIIAVWKTKHMIKLAKFQSKLRLFAGLLIPTKKGVAVLGGGDIGFPLLFAATVMRDINLLSGLIIPIFSTASLFLLFYFSKKKKFYPAMPFLSLGCFFGYIFIKLFL